MRNAIVVSAALIGTGCSSSSNRFLCEEDVQCNLRPAGRCFATQAGGFACGYPEQACDSGFAYDDGGSLVGVCVPSDVSPDAGPTADATELPDANPAVPCRVAYRSLNALWIANVDGTNAQSIVPDLGVSRVSWSRTDRLAFAATREGRWDVFTIAPDGSDERNLTRNLASPDSANPLRNLDPVWSRDGSKILFRRTDANGSVAAMWVMAADGSLAQEITTFVTERPSWSSNDAAILFSRRTTANGDLYVVPSAGGLAKRITHTDDADESGVWSPDGSRIIFERKLAGGSYDIWVMAGDGSNAINLTPDTTSWELRPQVTPDGRTILFSSDREGTAKIFAMPANGGNAVRLSDHAITGDRFLGDWIAATDGVRVLFTRDETADKAIVGTMRLDGSELHLFPEGAVSAYALALSPCL